MTSPRSIRPVFFEESCFIACNFIVHLAVTIIGAFLVFFLVYAFVVIKVCLEERAEREILRRAEMKRRAKCVKEIWPPKGLDLHKILMH